MRKICKFSVFVCTATGHLAAVHFNQGDKSETYFAETDHLGSVLKLVDSKVHSKYEARYTPFGVRTIARNDLGYNFPRGYTMHEHLDQFGVINANARLYDPFLARFLSPDPYIQEPTNPQNFNRYSYCLNNPLKYTDPSGERFFVCTALTFVIDFFVKGFFESGFDVTSSSARRDAWRKFDPTSSGSKTNNAYKIDKGLFRTDPNKNFFQRSFKLFSRFTREAGQEALGNFISHIRNNTQDVSVDYYNGVTLINRDKQNARHAFTLGSYINSRQVELGSDMFYHELGHTIQSRLLGRSYLPLVAVQSLVGAQLDNWGWHDHDLEWYETYANKHAHHYLKKYEPNDFVTIKNFHTISTKWDESHYQHSLHLDWYWIIAHP